MDSGLILILCVIFAYCIINNLGKAVKNSFKLPKIQALPFTAFVFLVLACLHYEEDCWSSDFLCVNYPHGFYTILRFVVCFYFSYNAYLIWKEKQINSSCMLSLLFAITYNPFVKVKFEVETWVFINIISILALIIYQIKQKK